MDAPIIITLTILALAVLLFVTDLLRVDLVALLVLSALALSGLVSPAEAISGFSNPAVITVWAVFIISAGMSRTGVASAVGWVVLRLAGTSTAQLIMVIMVAAGVMSAFMNNVGVAALLLPVVMDIARKTGRQPGQLLMPLAFGCLMGGLNTLIGTPPNLLVSDALRDANLKPFAMFDFLPMGSVLMLAGIAYMALLGRRLLPQRDAAQSPHVQDRQQLAQVYDLGKRISILRIPPDSPFIGQTLLESRLGRTLGINVIAILNEDQPDLAPGPATRLRQGDRLLVAGRLDWLHELRSAQHLEVEAQTLRLEDLVSQDVIVSEVQLAPGSMLVGQSLRQLDFRRRFGLIVLALWRTGTALQTGVDDLPLQAEDILLVQGSQQYFQALHEDPDFVLLGGEHVPSYELDTYLLRLRVPTDSTLVGKTLAESRLADAFGLSVLGIDRNGDTHLMPGADMVLQAEDHLLVKGRRENLLSLRGLQNLEIDDQIAPSLSTLQSEQAGMVEVVLSPHTSLAGKTLRQLAFREKYGLSVLAIWRGGRAYRHNLRSMDVRFGDALLVFGQRQKLQLLAREPDFIVLQTDIQEPVRRKKAPLAVGLMLSVVLSVSLGWLPISVAAVAGAALMILSGCLTMDEAYRYIEWKAVFLIAGMLPLGLAMQNSGAANLLAGQLVSLVAPWGSFALLVALFLLATLLSLVMPNSVVAVLLAPIAIQTAGQLGFSPQAMVMIVAVAASANFLSPVGQPANVLVMGPGGYRFMDYIKVGAPLSLIVLILAMLLLPVLWPL